jgi:hypothetical protein
MLEAVWRAEGRGDGVWARQGRLLLPHDTVFFPLVFALPAMVIAGVWCAADCLARFRVLLDVPPTRW